MIRFALLFLVAAALAAFGFGWLSNPGANAPDAPIASGRLTAPTVPRPGAGVVGAASYFSELNPPPPPPPPPPKPPKPVPPPPPDISLVFRRRLAAVVPAPQGGGFAVLVLDVVNGARQSRLLKRGDVFEDGWVLADVTRQDAQLTKGREIRRIAFFGPPSPPPPPPPSKIPPKIPSKTAAPAKARR